MKWINRYKTHYYYTDKNSILKPVYIAKYMQETALDALINLRPTPETLAEKGLAFILSRMSFRFYGEIRKYEEIAVETWALPPKTASFGRNYRISTAEGIKIEAASVWALVNTETKTIARPSVIAEYYGATDGEELSFEPPRRLPRNVEARPAFTRETLYSDLDDNGHMNNAVYIDIVHNAAMKRLPDNTGGARMTSLDIVYSAETLLGDILAVYAEPQDGTVSVAGKTQSGKVTFEARTEFSNEK